MPTFATERPSSSRSNSYPRGSENAIPGYVYILTNASYRGHLKIGRTTHDPAERAARLSSHTGVLTPFAVSFQLWVSDCREVESRVHRKLARQRVNRRKEFFRVSLVRAEGVIWRVADEVGRGTRKTQQQSAARHGSRQPPLGYGYHAAGDVLSVTLNARSGRGHPAATYRIRKGKLEYEGLCYDLTHVHGAQLLSKPQPGDPYYVGDLPGPPFYVGLYAMPGMDLEVVVTYVPCLSKRLATELLEALTEHKYWSSALDVP